MKRLWLPLFVCLMFLVMQCGGEEQKPPEAELCDACLNAAPDATSLEIRIPGDEESDINTMALGELAFFYTQTRQMSDDTNFWILGTLGWLDEILTYPPTEHSGGYCIWGPFIPSGLSPVEQRFRMQQNSETDYTYFWEERPKNTEDEWTMIWGGAIEPATDTARRGIGQLNIDFTAAYALDPALQQEGQIEVDYDTYTDGRRIDITFIDFMDLRPGQMTEPMDAAYHYHNRADNSGEFDFSFLADVHQEEWGETYPELETLTYATQWLPSGAGGCTCTVTGGDLSAPDYPGLTAPLEEIVETECWNELFLRTYYVAVFKLEDGTEVTMDEEGDPTDCVL